MNAVYQQAKNAEKEPSHINMNINSLLLWGFAATLILTIIMVGSKYLGLTRIDLPFMLGTAFTGSRDKAVRIGILGHAIMGWFFAFIYAAAFETSALKTWWLGMAIGFVHGCIRLNCWSANSHLISSSHGPSIPRPHSNKTA